MTDISEGMVPAPGSADSAAAGSADIDGEIRWPLWKSAILIASTSALIWTLLITGFLAVL